MKPPIVPVVFCTLVMATMSMNPPNMRHFTCHDPEQCGFRNAEVNTDSRVKRSVISILGKILSGTRVIKRDGKNYILYQKDGGIYQAKEDFKAFKVSNIQYKKIGLYGMADDSTLVILKDIGMPRLKLWNFITDSRGRIIQIDKMEIQYKRPTLQKK